MFKLFRKTKKQMKIKNIMSYIHILYTILIAILLQWNF